MIKCSYDISGGDFARAGFASTEIKKILKQLNIDAQVIRRTVISVYEAEVNVVAHAYKGTMDLSIDNNQIIVVIKDSGPGIPDIKKAMEPGFTTATEKVREMGFGAGMGLPNIQEHSNNLQIESELGKGTIVTITINLNS